MKKAVIMALMLALIPMQTQAHEYSEIFSQFTTEDFDLMKKIVACESQTEPITGRIAVCEVIMNRILSEQYPDTLLGVVSQVDSGYVQFSSYRHRDDSWVVPSMAEEAVNTVRENGLSVLPSVDYVYFSRKGEGKERIRIHNHVFGKDKRK